MPTGYAQWRIFSSCLHLRQTMHLAISPCKHCSLWRVFSQRFPKNKSMSFLVWSRAKLTNRNLYNSIIIFNSLAQFIHQSALGLGENVNFRGKMGATSCHPLWCNRCVKAFWYSSTPSYLLGHLMDDVEAILQRKGGMLKGRDHCLLNNYQYILGRSHGSF